MYRKVKTNHLDIILKLTCIVEKSPLYKKLTMKPPPPPFSVFSLIVYLYKFY
jgi:hypothetical protein